MSASCPFLSLPADLVGLVVMAFLDLADVVHLDSACCSRESRGQWSRLSPMAPPIDVISVQRRQVLHVLNWLKNRGMKVSTVTLSGGCSDLVQFTITYMDIVKSVRVNFDAPKTLDAEIESNVAFAERITHWAGSKISRSMAEGALTNLFDLCLTYMQHNMKVIAEAISATQKLTHLKLAFGTIPDDTLFAVLPMRASTLIELDLSVMHGLGDDFASDLWAQVARCCPRLQVLRYEPAKYVQNHRDRIYLDPTVADCFSRARTELRDLFLFGFNVPTDSLLLLLQRCPRLQKIQLPDTTVGDAELLALSTRCLDGAVDPYPVTNLTVSWAVTNTATLTRCSAFLGSLRDLDIRSIAADWNSLAVAFPFMPELRSLQFMRDPNDPTNTETQVSTAILRAVATHCRDLRRLVIQAPLGEDCDNGVARVLSECRKLERLMVQDFDKRPFITDGAFTGITSPTVGHSKGHVPWLSSVTLYAPELSDLGVTDLARRFPGLHSIRLINAGKLTDKSFLSLAQYCPQLRVIDIYGAYEPRQPVQLSAAVLDALCGACPRLRSLTAAGQTFACRKITEIRARRPSEGAGGAPSQ